MAPPFETKWKKSTDPTEGKYPGFRPNVAERVDGMDITWDVEVPMRDGTKLYVDIFCPESATTNLPVILTYSPYGKHGPKTFDIFPNSGVPKGSVSKYAVWEGPDPLYWTKKGYAMVNADARGSWASEGNCTILSADQGVDGYDIVEWIAEQPFSNGRVGLCGVSYLAIIQWRVAELNPPHLSAIMPWEGLSDAYRDATHHGGIPETNFLKFTEWSCRAGFNQVEDWVGMQKEHGLFDAYHESKQAKLHQIKCPAYVVADWGDQGLHTRGTLLGFSEIGSSEKWLEVHGQKKWQYFYQPTSLRRQEAFFQKFLKQQPSEVDIWPPVSIEIREKAFEGYVRAENEWPLQRTRPTRKFLDLTSGKLVDNSPDTTQTASYDSEKDQDHIDLQYTFDSDTELTGGMCLRLNISTDHSSSADDLDIFVQLDKLTASGAVVPFVAMSMLDDGPLALGWLRASHRELDASKSTDLAPYHSHTRELKLKPGEIVPVYIEIWPSSTRFVKGESLRVRIQGNDIFRYDLPQVQLHQDSVNKGRHWFYSGGDKESYLLMPVVETP